MIRRYNKEIESIKEKEVNNEQTLDYMVVITNYQRRGIGRKLFEFTNNELNR